MNKLTYQGIIEDIRDARFLDSEIEKLLAIFTKAVSCLNSDIFEKYWDNIGDSFDLSQKSKIYNVSLKIKKKDNRLFSCYIAEFELDKKNLKIYAKSKI